MLRWFMGRCARQSRRPVEEVLLTDILIHAPSSVISVSHNKPLMNESEIKRASPAIEKSISDFGKHASTDILKNQIVPLLDAKSFSLFSSTSRKFHQMKLEMIANPRTDVMR